MKHLRTCLFFTTTLMVLVSVLLCAGIAQATPVAKCSWKVIASTLPPGGANSTFLEITAITANDAWAVGTYNDKIGNQYTFAEHWDGTQWNYVSSPNPAGTTNSWFTAVSATSTSDVWAVGYYFKDSANANQTLIEHWNGTAWSIVASPDSGTGSNFLTGVSTIASNNVWAVGTSSNLNSSYNQRLMEHWDGTSWSVVSTPGPKKAPGTAFTSVTAISASDVWTVGTVYSAKNVTKTLTEHWNGTAWSMVASPSPGVGSQGSLLNGVTAIATNDVWAVGAYYPKNSNTSRSTLTEHWNGTQWSVVKSQNAPKGVSGSGFAAATSISSTDVWAVGSYYDSNFDPQSLVEHWNGTSWSVKNNPNPGTFENILWGVTHVPATPKTIWTVGITSNQLGSGQAFTERYC